MLYHWRKGWINRPCRENWFSIKKKVRSLLDTTYERMGIVIMKERKINKIRALLVSMI